MSAAARPLLLDLFCGAGGAAKGYQLAGFDLVGVDVKPQPRYLGQFIQADALAFVAEHGWEYDAIHASPPCQAHTSMRTMHNAKPHTDLVRATRDALTATGKPYVIENVVGAPLHAPLLLCGTMFGLGIPDAELRRHRLFETSFHIPRSGCAHGTKPRTMGIYGKGVRDSRRKFDKTVPEFTVWQGRAAMGIGWMTLAELCQAIPPAFTRYIGLHLLASLDDQQNDGVDGASTALLSGIGEGVTSAGGESGFPRRAAGAA